MTPLPHLVLAAADAAPLAEPVASGPQLVVATLSSIALIVVLITRAKFHPLLALILGGRTVGIVAGQNINAVITSFSTGFGTTATGVGALIADGDRALGQRTGVRAAARAGRLRGPRNR